MKTITYDQRNYEVIDTVEYGDDMFQKVRFPEGNYGIAFIMPKANVYDIILVGTDNDDTYVDVFLEFVRNQTNVLKAIEEGVDEVTLAVKLNGEQSEVFKQTISREESDDLVERLKITNEILEMKSGQDMRDYRMNVALAMAFLIVNVIMLVCLLKGYGGTL